VPRTIGPGNTGPGEPGPGGKVASEPSLFTPGYSGGRAARRDDAGLGSAWTNSGPYGAGQHGGGPYGAGQHGGGPYGAGQHGGGPYGTGPHGSPGSAAGKGPIRGFPPAPGKPPPLYPPGQFSAWNRAPWPGSNGYADPGATGPDNAAWPIVDRAAPEVAAPGPAGAALAEPGYPDPRYAGCADVGYADAGYADPGYSALAVSDPAADVTSTQTWGVVDGDSTTASGWPDLDSPAERGQHADPYSGHIPPGAEYATGLAAPDEALARTADSGVGGPGSVEPGLAGPDARPSPAEPGPAGPRWDQADDRGRGAPGAAGRVGGPVTRPGREPVRRQSTRGHGSRGRARSRGRNRRSRIPLVVGLAVAVVAGAAGYLWFSGRHHLAAPAAALHRAAPRPSATDPSPSPTPSLGVWGHIASRASDPVPLTLAELFPAQFADGGAKYTRTVQKARVHCSGALIGSALTGAVSHAGCTQVMRASYLSSGNKLMGTIGVLNLATVAAAEKAGKAAGPAEFIAQLPAATGPTKKLTRGTGIEAAEVKGHYLVLVWAELTNLHAPKSAAQRQELEAFISVLIQKTANVSLASRMVTGRPAS
jgi:hypothetical protein